MSNKIKEILSEIGILNELLEKLPENEKQEILRYIDETTEKTTKEIEQILDSVDEKQIDEFMSEINNIDITFSENKNE